MARLACTIVCTVFLSTPALAQVSQLERARFLLMLGSPEAALTILETLPETPAVLQGRAQAHLMIASQIAPPGRCDHLRRAIDFGSMASPQGVVELARKRFRNEGCQIARRGAEAHATSPHYDVGQNQVATSPNAPNQAAMPSRICVVSGLPARPSISRIAPASAKAVIAKALPIFRMPCMSPFAPSRAAL
jgi:hypothetical protein